MAARKDVYDVHQHPIMLPAQPGYYDAGNAKLARQEFAMELRRAAQKARDLGLTVPAIDLEAMAGVVDVRAVNEAVELRVARRRTG